MKKIVRKIFENKINKYIDFRIKKIMDADFFVPIDTIQENDIFIVAYPKSGITWLQSLITGVLLDMDTNFLTDHLYQEIVPDVHARKFYKRFFKFNFFKSHSLPQGKYKKVIYLVRDGRDVMTSYFFFNKELGHNITLDDMIFEGKGIYPCKWYMHVSKWLENPYGSDIIYIRYEDLKNDPVKELKKICEFSGLQRSKQSIQKIIDGTSIDKMRKRVKENDGMAHKDWKGEKGEKFFRKGIIGDFENYLSPKHIEFFNKESQNELNEFNYL